MKKYKLIFLVTCILLLIFTLASCNNDEQPAPSTEYFTVNFNSNGGSPLDAIKVQKNSKITQLITPTRDGYIFDGWTRGGKKWDVNSEKVTEDLTLEAKWVDASSVYVTEALDTGVKIISVKRSFENMSVPSVIGGRPVVAIGDGVFEGTSTADTKSITVASSVTYIGNSAFKGCTGVSITVEGALTQVGELAFYGCDGLTGINLGEGLEHIPAQSFSGCSSLAELVLPSTVKLIDENAFEDCSGLVSIIMHGSLEAVLDGAFLGADALRTVYLYGTQQEADAIDVTPEGNGTFIEALEENLYFYSEERPSDDGKYWYFNDNGKIRIW